MILRCCRVTQEDGTETRGPLGGPPPSKASTLFFFPFPLQTQSQEPARGVRRIQERNLVSARALCVQRAFLRPSTGPRAASLGVSPLAGACWVRARPGVPGPRPRPARSGVHVWAGPGLHARRPSPFSKLSPNFQSFASAPRLASLMNYSAARAPISAPRAPHRAPAGRPPRPRSPPPALAPSPARRRPAQTQPGAASARPARPRAAVSLPPSLPSSRCVPAPAPTLPARAERTRSAA